MWDGMDKIQVSHTPFGWSVTLAMQIVSVEVGLSPLISLEACVSLSVCANLAVYPSNLNCVQSIRVYAKMALWGIVHTCICLKTGYPQLRWFIIMWPVKQPVDTLYTSYSILRPSQYTSTHPSVLKSTGFRWPGAPDHPRDLATAKLNGSGRGSCSTTNQSPEIEGWRPQIAV